MAGSLRERKISVKRVQMPEKMDATKVEGRMLASGRICIVMAVEFRVVVVNDSPVGAASFCVSPAAFA